MNCFTVSIQYKKLLRMNTFRICFSRFRICSSSMLRNEFLVLIPWIYTSYWFGLNILGSNQFERIKYLLKKQPAFTKMIITYKLINLMSFHKIEMKFIIHLLPVLAEAVEFVSILAALTSSLAKQTQISAVRIFFNII